MTLPRRPPQQLPAEMASPSSSSPRYHEHHPRKIIQPSDADSLRAQGLLTGDSQRHHQSNDSGPWWLEVDRTCWDALLHGNADRLAPPPPPSPPNSDSNDGDYLWSGDHALTTTHRGLQWYGPRHRPPLPAAQTVSVPTDWLSVQTLEYVGYSRMGAADLFARWEEWLARRRGLDDHHRWGDRYMYFAPRREAFFAFSMVGWEGHGYADEVDGYADEMDGKGWDPGRLFECLVVWGVNERVIMRVFDEGRAMKREGKGMGKSLLEVVEGEMRERWEELGVLGMASRWRARRFRGVLADGEEGESSELEGGKRKEEVEEDVVGDSEDVEEDSEEEEEDEKMAEDTIVLGYRTDGTSGDSASPRAH